MQYRYKLHGYNDNQDFLSAVQKIKDVTEVLVDDGDLLVTVSDRAYEFDFLNALFAVSEDFNIVLDMGDNEEENADNGPIDGDLPEELPESAPKTTAKPVKKDNKVVNDILDDNDYDDALEKGKKEFKKDVIARAIELLIAIAVFGVSFIFEISNQTFSVRTILTIIAFSVAGYEAVYQAFFEIAKKRFFDGSLISLLAAVVLIIVGYSDWATAFIILFAIAQAVVTLSDKKRKLLVDEAFYTGSLPVLLDGKYVAVNTLKQGNVITLNPGDVVPCDGTILCDGQLSSYTVDFSDKLDYQEGDLVLAGSVVINQKITVKLTKNYGESLIDVNRKTFEDRTALQNSPKYKKIKKIGLYVDILVLFAALIISFLLPLKESNYVSGLIYWAQRGALLLTFTLASFAINLVWSLRQNIYAIAILKGISLGDDNNIAKIAKANALKISPYLLLDDTLNSINKGSLPILNELHQAGLQNIVVDFEEAPIPEDIKKQLDFVQSPLKRENMLYIGNGTGDISVRGGDTNILNGQIGFAPVAYKLCKNARKTKNVLSVLLIAVKLACIIGTFFIPFKTLSMLVWVILCGLVVAISSLTTFLSVSKIN